MIVLDENIIASQCALLQSWRIRFRQVGQEIGRKGMQDDDIPPLLRRSRPPTFFTRDLGFYDRNLCHERYCLVTIGVAKEESAIFIRRFLRHKQFSRRALRMGKVVQLSHAGIRWWSLRRPSECRVDW